MKTDKQYNFNDRVALVTGGGTGIGKAITRELVRYGARVCIVSRNEEHLTAARNEISSGILTRVCDVRRPDQVSRTFDHIIGEWGRLDILVNNAAGNFIAPAADLSPGGWKVVIDIVLNGTYYCSHFAGKIMRDQKYGKILNIVATYAWTGNAGTIHSAAAKAGVVALTRTLAVEWAAWGIRTNALAPGPVNTEGARKNLWSDENSYRYLKNQVPVKRFAEESEIAHCALFLLSDQADYINGEVLVIDGGLWLNRTMFDIDTLSNMPEKNQ